MDVAAVCNDGRTSPGPTSRQGGGSRGPGRAPHGGTARGSVVPLLDRATDMHKARMVSKAVLNEEEAKAGILDGTQKKVEKDAEAAKRESLKNILVFAEPGKFVLERKLRKGKSKGPSGKKDKSMRASLIDTMED